MTGKRAGTILKKKEVTRIVRENFEVIIEADVIVWEMRLLWKVRDGS